MQHLHISLSLSLSVYIYIYIYISSVIGPALPGLGAGGGGGGPPLRFRRPLAQNGDHEDGGDSLLTLCAFTRDCGPLLGPQRTSRDGVWVASCTARLSPETKEDTCKMEAKLAEDSFLEAAEAPSRDAAGRPAGRLKELRSAPTWRARGGPGVGLLP